MKRAKRCVGMSDEVVGDGYEDGEEELAAVDVQRSVECESEQGGRGAVVMAQARSPEWARRMDPTRGHEDMQQGGVKGGGWIRVIEIRGRDKGHKLLTTQVATPREYPLQFLPVTPALTEQSPPRPGLAALKGLFYSFCGLEMQKLILCLVHPAR